MPSPGRGREAADEFHGLRDDAVAFLTADGTLAMHRSGADVRPMTGGENVGRRGAGAGRRANSHGEGDAPTQRLAAEVARPQEMRRARASSYLNHCPR